MRPTPGLSAGHQVSSRTQRGLERQGAVSPRRLLALTNYSSDSLGWFIFTIDNVESVRELAQDSSSRLVRLFRLQLSPHLALRGARRNPTWARRALGSRYQVWVWSPNATLPTRLNPHLGRLLGRLFLSSRRSTWPPRTGSASCRTVAAAAHSRDTSRRACGRCASQWESC